MHLPIRDNTELLDSEYANDTAFYVSDDVESLQRVRLALEVFCLAAEVKINSHKSIGFLILELAHNGVFSLASVGSLEVRRRATKVSR